MASGTVLQSSTLENHITEDPTNGEEVSEEPPKLHISIHSLIESAQSQHGLRHTDYAQYRSYCTRRLSRLRHAKPFRLELSKIATKGAEKSSGGGNKTARHAFRPAPYYRDESLALEIAKTNENFMLVELMSAERAWCYALELKAEYDNNQPNIMSNSGNSEKGKSRGHFMARLKKAVQFANRLQEMAIAAADERTIIEAKGYAAWMRGNLSLEKSDYKSACVEYATALAICRELSQGSYATEEDVPSLEMRDYFTARAENVIEPMLRFCQYELKDGGMSDIEIMDLMNDIPFKSSNTEKEGSNLNANTTTTSTSSISFRNQTVPISNHALRVKLLKLDTLISTYNKNKLTKHKDAKKSKKQELAFLDLLSGYDDANTIVSKEFKEMEGMKSGPAVDAKKQELQSIAGYLKYKKLTLMMDRKEEMVNELRQKKTKDMKLEEIAHLYDALLQDARAVASLPGAPVVMNDEGNPVPVEDDFILEANAQILRFRALRCYYLGSMYSEKQKWKEAIALFNHALALANDAAEELSACTSDDLDTNAVVEAMVELEKDISGAKCRSEAYAYLARIGKLPSTSSNGSRSLLERLDDFDGGSSEGGAEKYHLATVPPSLQYIPCKPVFFDIALNHMGELPVAEFHKLVEENTPKSSSLLGWFRRG